MPSILKNIQTFFQPEPLVRTLIAKRLIGDVSLEYSSIREKAYQAVRTLWRDLDDKTALTEVVNKLRSPTQEFISYDHLYIVEILHKRGLISEEFRKKGQDKKYSIVCSVTDKEFFNALFYTKENSSVLHLATVTYIETRKIQQQDVSHEYSLEPLVEENNDDCCDLCFFPFK